MADYRTSNFFVEVVVDGQVLISPRRGEIENVELSLPVEGEHRWLSLTQCSRMNEFASDFVSPLRDVPDDVSGSIVIGFTDTRGGNSMIVAKADFIDVMSDPFCNIIRHRQSLVTEKLNFFIKTITPFFEVDGAAVDDDGSVFYGKMPVTLHGLFNRASGFSG